MTFNLLVFNRRSIFDYQRRTDLSNAVQTKNCYHIISPTETWLTKHIPDSVLLLPSYEVHRKGRPSDSSITKHGSMLVAVIRNVPTNEIVTDFQDCLIILLNLSSPINRCSLYNALKTSRYSWTTDRFQELIKFLRLTQLRHNAAQTYIRGDFKFDSTHWPTMFSSSEEEQLIYNDLCELNFQQRPITPTESSLNVFLCKKPQKNINVNVDNRIKPLFSSDRPAHFFVNSSRDF